MSREVRRRVWLAVAIPLGSAGFVALLLWAFSRVLLAVPVAIAPVVALLFAMNVLVGSALAAIARTRRSFAVITGLMVGVVLVSGVAAYAVGEQPVPSHVAHEEPTGPPPVSPGEPTGETTPPPQPPGDVDVRLVAEGLLFDTDVIELPAGGPAAIEVDNRDAGQTHNLAIYTELGGETIFQGEPVVGPATATYVIEIPEPGEYFFQCDFHPATMTGTAVVG